MAHAAFDEIQKEMQSLAPVVAKEKGWSVTDYRDVIRELKKDQLVGDAILPHYQARLKDLEADHRAREAGDAADAARAHPARLGGGDRGVAGAQHAAAAPGRQHRRAG